jgi:CRISPR-associated protein Cas1
MFGFFANRSLKTGRGPHRSQFSPHLPCTLSTGDQARWVRRFLRWTEIGSTLALKRIQGRRVEVSSMRHIEAFPSPLSQGKILVVDGYGVEIRVERSHLRIRTGSFGSAESEDIEISRGRIGMDRLVVFCRYGTISLDAIDWCHRAGVPIAFVGSDSRLINCVVPDQAHDGPVKRAQALSATTDDALRLARLILTRKFMSQIHALEVGLGRVGLPHDPAQTAPAISEIRSCTEGLAEDATLDALLVREGWAAKHYWGCLTGRALPWPGWALRRIPAHWARISPRVSGGRDRVRDARDPYGALTNYCYTLLEVETRIACAAHGLDPDLGILHVDERLRESFLYDLMEPVRAVVDMFALEFIHARGLRPYMFHERRDGVVRLDPVFAKPLAQWLMPRLREPLAEVAAAYVAELRRVKVPYRLSRFNRSPASGYRKGRIPPTNPGTCEYCHQPVPKKGLKFCGRHCYIRHSVEVRQPIKLAQQRLAEMRAEGLDPGHGGQAAKKRGTKLALSNRRRAMNLTEEQWRARRALQARLRRRIGRATGGHDIGRG